LIKGYSLGRSPEAWQERQGGSVLGAGIRDWGLLLIQAWIISKFLKHLRAAISVLLKQGIIASFCKSTLRLLVETLEGCKILAISY